MIPEASVKSLARRLGVDPAVIDRDHALGVVLWALSPDLSSARWVFKGGTCLRKCHFGDYRFSEDLDFTVAGRLTPAVALSLVQNAAPRAGSAGIRLLMEDARTIVQNDEHGRESIEIKVPYRGALRTPNPPNMQFHLSADEELVFDAVNRALMHEYDDAAGLGVSSVECYALEEILAEKLRAVGGQRRYAIARDVYDIAQLVRRGADTGAALEALPRKTKRKALVLEGAAARFRARRAEYRASWESSLAYLVVDSLGFDEAFEIAAGLLST
ncbi:MAG: nucleotidyl transferase AbiEii/AbiGii toxin family protein [Thermoleophilia bacterium]|nr:nucleotidyl transferase AbiEii/AbiGii toxin family protein [Thermoleophilia bacterium]